MRNLGLSTAVLLGVFSTSLYAGLNEAKLVDEIRILAKKQKEVSEQIQAIEKLLGIGTALQDVSWMDLPKGSTEDLKAIFEKAYKHFTSQEYAEAKELLQDAWEVDPISKEVNHNLGLTYVRLDRPVLAKKFFSQALDAKGDLPDHAKILAYVKGENSKDESPKKEIAKVDNAELKNLQKKTDSLIRSPYLKGPKKIKEVAASLELIESKLADKEGVEDYYTYLSDAYSAFEMYPEALRSLKNYEVSMKGKELPDDFFTKKLDLERKSKELSENLDALWKRNVGEDTRYLLENDVHEMQVFASQFEEFAHDPSMEDKDFSMICERLGEYPWGKKNNRHVMVLSRYQEVLYSSLPGTLPIDRYQDVHGNKFLKHIVQIPQEDLALKEVKLMSLDLNVNGEVVPYVILYTYIPKLESFVVVRINEKDLNAS